MAQASRTTTVRLSPQLAESLDAACDRLGIPLNSLIAIACSEWLEHHEPGKPAEAAQKPGLVRRLRGPRMFRFSRFTIEAREMLILAQHDAEASGGRYLKPHHLVQAMLATPATDAGRALAGLGVTAGQALDGDDRRAVASVLRRATEAAGIRGDDQASSADILIGLAQEGVLRDITEDRVRAALA